MTIFFISILQHIFKKVRSHLSETTPSLHYKSKLPLGLRIVWNPRIERAGKWRIMWYIHLPLDMKGTTVSTVLHTAARIHSNDQKVRKSGPMSCFLNSENWDVDRQIWRPRFPPYLFPTPTAYKWYWTVSIRQMLGLGWINGNHTAFSLLLQASSMGWWEQKSLSSDEGAASRHVCLLHTRWPSGGL